MPFRPRFDCLWCGRAWETRSPDDLEGWAALCPECLGKADDNGFLRMRLRSALRERAASVAAPAVAPSAAPTVGPDHDAWYLRGGRFSRGPLFDGPWQMELDEVTRWVDGLPMEGILVELDCGSGWWSALLAGKGELWLYDADDASLDAARKRLMAHGLLAHLHQRDALAPADKTVDVVFAAFLLGAAETATGLAQRIAAAKRWLKPGASFVFVEAQMDRDGGSLAGPAGPLWPREGDTLHELLVEAGFGSVELGQTASAFVFGRAVLSP